MISSWAPIPSRALCRADDHWSTDAVGARRVPRRAKSLSIKALPTPPTIGRERLRLVCKGSRRACSMRIRDRGGEEAGRGFPRGEKPSSKRLHRPRLTRYSVLPRLRARRLARGAIAQLGERYNGIVEVAGSIPAGSTTSRFRCFASSPSSRGLGHRPFTAVTGVRIPMGTPLPPALAGGASLPPISSQRAGFSPSAG